MKKLKIVVLGLIGIVSIGALGFYSAKLLFNQEGTNEEKEESTQPQTQNFDWRVPYFVDYKNVVYNDGDDFHDVLRKELPSPVGLNQLDSFYNFNYSRVPDDDLKLANQTALNLWSKYYDIEHRKDFDIIEVKEDYKEDVVAPVSKDKIHFYKGLDNLPYISNLKRIDDLNIDEFKYLHSNFRTNQELYPTFNSVYNSKQGAPWDMSYNPSFEEMWSVCLDRLGIEDIKFDKNKSGWEYSIFYDNQTGVEGQVRYKELVTFDDKHGAGVVVEAPWVFFVFRNDEYKNNSTKRNGELLPVYYLDLNLTESSSSFTLNEPLIFKEDGSVHQPDAVLINIARYLSDVYYRNIHFKNAYMQPLSRAESNIGHATVMNPYLLERVDKIKSIYPLYLEDYIDVYGDYDAVNSELPTD